MNLITQSLAGVLDPSTEVAPTANPMGGLVEPSGVEQFVQAAGVEPASATVQCEQTITQNVSNHGVASADGGGRRPTTITTTQIRQRAAAGPGVARGSIVRAISTCRPACRPQHVGVK